MTVPIRKFNPYHDAAGRFTTATGGGGLGTDSARDAAYRAKVKQSGDREPYSRSKMATDLRTPDGGFTYDLGTSSAVTAGFAVSPYPERSKAIDGVKGMSDSDIDRAVNSYISDNSDLLSRPRHYLGGWHDPKTGRVWLDVSVVEDSTGEAYRMGLEYDQIAYFDLQNFESVDINRDAKSGQPEDAIAKYDPRQPRDDQGRWSPMGGYPAAAHGVAAQLHKNALAVEPAITAKMVNSAERYGARLDGLAFRIKGKDSLARKIDDMAARSGITHEQAGDLISDSVRYTMVLADHNYTRGTAEVLDGFRAEGYTARVKNYWQKGDPYQGINVAMTSPDGTNVELQFHTESSLATKEVIHLDYEAYRTSGSNDERRMYWNRMIAEANRVPVPDLVTTLPELRQQTFEPAL